METKELVERLRDYNDWRGGEHEEQPCPKDIGVWIDKICARVDEQKKQIKELWESVKKLNVLHDEAFARLVVAEEERDRAKSALNDQCRGNNRLHEVNENLLAEVVKARRERDEAREALAATKHYLTKERDDALAQIVQAECRAERFCQERDEARETLREIQAANWRTAGELRGMARRALSPKEYAATSRAKREGEKKGEQFVKQPKKIAEKTAKYR